jgi:predicted DNA binding CopG/RHH family protein
MKDNISEDEVFQDYQNGLPEDFKLEEAKIRRKPVDLKKATVQISMKIEYGLLQEIKQTAEKEGIPYQTLMKRILRDHLKHSSLEQRVQKIEKKLAELTSHP